MRTQIQENILASVPVKWLSEERTVETVTNIFSREDAIAINEYRIELEVLRELDEKILPF